MEWNGGVQNRMLACFSDYIAIAVIIPLCYDNADRLRLHIKLYLSKQIKLLVLDAHGIQITRLYLKCMNSIT